VRLRLLARCGLLALAFALTTFALFEWQASGFTVHDVWPFSETVALHPLHVLMLGVAMIPPALWEIFILDHAVGVGDDEKPQ
jgi:hypothetical protein